MSAELIYLFPGQSSRDPAMFDRAIEAAGGRLEDPRGVAARHAGRPIDPAFGANLDIQLGVMAVILTYLRLLTDAGIRPVASAGLSLGEYAHLAAIGALDAEPLLDLVAERGRTYDAGPRGSMVAVQPASVSQVEGILEEVRKQGGWRCDDLVVSNDNSPSQCVVAGAEDAVNHFVEKAEEELYVQCVTIEGKIPMHTGRFRSAADRLRPALEDAPWQPPHQVYWPNVTALPVIDAQPADFVRMLCRHVFSRVLWRQTVDALAAVHPEAIFVEVGPKTVLRDMMTRRWIRRDRFIVLDPYEDRAGFAEALDRMTTHAR